MTGEVDAGWLADRRWFAGERPVHPGEPRTTPVGDLRVTLVPVPGPRRTTTWYQMLSADPIRLDALDTPATIGCLAASLAGCATANGDAGTVRFTSVAPVPTEHPRPMGAEQSNTSTVVGEAVVMKAYRRLRPGEHVELEVLRHLDEVGFPHVPPLVGWWEVTGGPVDATLGVAQRLVVGGRDGWQLTLERLGHDDRGMHHIAWIRLLGTTVAELHTALGSGGPGTPFGPEPGGRGTARDLARRIARAAESTLPRLTTHPVGAELAGAAAQVAARATALADRLDVGALVRTHGDLHLGQTILGPDGWVLLDFEGEPSRSMDERRARQPGLRDVAGVLRSFDYAAATHARSVPTAAPRGWVAAARAALLDGYLTAADPALLPAGPVAVTRLLALLELEKVVYEIGYELDHRPDWVGIPVEGLTRLLGREP